MTPPHIMCLVARSCPTLCDLMDCSAPGSSVHGILQARILEWIAIPFSRRSSWPRDQTLVSCIAGWFFTLWATRQAPSYYASAQKPPIDLREQHGFQSHFLFLTFTKSVYSKYVRCFLNMLYVFLTLDVFTQEYHLSYEAFVWDPSPYYQVWSQTPLKLHSILIPSLSLLFIISTIILTLKNAVDCRLLMIRGDAVHNWG